jgi:hypothetical protein
VLLILCQGSKIEELYIQSCCRFISFLILNLPDEDGLMVEYIDDKRCQCYKPFFCHEKNKLERLSETSTLKLEYFEEKGKSLFVGWKICKYSTLLNYPRKNCAGDK